MPNPSVKSAEADRRLNEAMTHHQAGRLAEAESAYNDVLKANARNVDALRLLGALYVHTGRFAAAEELLFRAVQAQPGNAETLNNLGVALRNQGRLEDALKRFERAVAAKPDYATARRNLANALRDLGCYEDAFAHYRHALAQQPDDPQLLADFGLALYAQDRFEDAAKHFTQALRLRPDYFAAHMHLGNVQQAQGKSEEAIASYTQALRLQPQAAEVLVNLGAAWWDLNRLDKALECYEEALRLKPGYIEALINYGTALRGAGRHDEAAAKYNEVLQRQPGHTGALINLGTLLHEQNRLDEALAKYEEALRVKPGLADAAFRKSLILLARGDYAEGWKLYETGLGKRNLRGPSRFRDRQWDGAAAPGKRLLIRGEQGHGDTLQFVRYAALCKERVGKVAVLCSQPLQRLLRSCPFIDEVTGTITDGDFDLQAAMMSLPHLFGTTLANVPARTPYLFADPVDEAKWATKLADFKGVKVGIVWAGNAREGQINAHATDRRRSVGLERLEPLFALENIAFVNLQMGPAAGQIDALGLRGRIADFMDDVKDFADTAAVIRQLDLVITVDTSVAHLAGGLGKPVWILSRYDACWRWLGNRADSPWYPSARIFGQDTPGDWDSVVTQVRDALAGFKVSG